MRTPISTCCSCRKRRARSSCSSSLGAASSRFVEMRLQRRLVRQHVEERRGPAAHRPARGGGPGFAEAGAALRWWPRGAPDRDVFQRRQEMRPRQFAQEAVHGLQRAIGIAAVDNCSSSSGTILMRCARAASQRRTAACPPAGPHGAAAATGSRKPRRRARQGGAVVRLGRERQFAVQEGGGAHCPRTIAHNGRCPRWRRSTKADAKLSRSS